MSSSSKFLSVFVFSTLGFLISSYLLFLKDAFRIELVTYLLGFPHLEPQLLNLASQLKVNYTAPLALSLSLIGLWLAYLKLIPTITKLSFRHLATVIIPVYLLIIASFPILSSDVFDYNNTNRLAFIHQQNPWAVASNQIANDTQLYLGSWTFRASIYPPLSLASFSLVHFIFGQNLILNTLGFKLINLAYLILGLWVIYRLKPHLLGLIALNPLILIESLSSPHNDLLTGLLVLLAFYYWHQQHPVGATLAWVGSILAKATPLLLAPLLLETAFKKSTKFLTLSLITLVISLLLTTILLGSNLSLIFTGLLSQQNHLYQSLPVLIRDLGGLIFHSPFSESYFRTFPTLLATTSLLVYWLKSTHHHLADRISLSFLIFLCFASPMIQPWYWLWFVFLLPLNSPRTRTLVIITSMLITNSYLVDQFKLYFNPFNHVWSITSYLLLVIPFISWFVLPKPWYTLSQTLFPHEKN